MFRQFYVNKDERALLFRKGDFVTILKAGEHRFFDPLGRLTIEKYSLAKTQFEHKLADYLVKSEPDIVAREFTTIALGAAEVGLRFENGVLTEVLAPNTRRVYWKGYIDVRVEKLNIATDFRVANELVAQLVELSGAGFKAKVTGAASVYGVQAPEPVQPWIQH